MADLSSHWLGLGEEGVRSLWREVSLSFLAADSFFYRESWLGDDEPSKLPEDVGSRATNTCTAVVIAESDAIPWHVGYLSERFDVVLWVETIDEILLSVSDEFGVQLADEVLPENLKGNVDFFLVPVLSWINADDFLGYLEGMMPYLKPGGRVCFALGALPAASDTTNILWDEGPQELSEFVELCREIPSVCLRRERLIPVASVHELQSEMLQRFEKRNRRFLGQRTIGEIRRELEGNSDPQPTSLLLLTFEPAHQ
ncbi:MAG: hypothetical protein KDD44_13300 [Bdellovibrionales bacterium]|nr:hypothetical protein [Bdellovibrionales bacterium]